MAFKLDELTAPKLRTLLSFQSDILIICISSFNLTHVFQSNFIGLFVKFCSELDMNALWLVTNKRNLYVIVNENRHTGCFKNQLLWGGGGCLFHVLVYRNSWSQTISMTVELVISQSFLNLVYNLHLAHVRTS